MAVFKVSEIAGTRYMIIRAACLTCARDIAVRSSPSSELMIWRDASRSKTEVIRDPESMGYLSEGRRGLIKRFS